MRQRQAVHCRFFAQAWRIILFFSHSLIQIHQGKHESHSI
jgi:hypothetical protein